MIWAMLGWGAIQCILRGDLRMQSSISRPLVIFCYTVPMLEGVPLVG